MSPGIIIMLVAVVVVLAAVALVLARPALRRQRLRMRFGPEYDQAVREHDGRHEAERDLLERERRHQRLELRTLEPPAREHYRAQWEAVQERFVDDPAGAAAEAERLITSIMTARGYPDEGHRRRLSDLSVGHPRTADHYRQAHRLSSGTSGDGTSTEDLRQAIVHYRALLDELLRTRRGAGIAAGRRPAIISGRGLGRVTGAMRPSASTRETAGREG